MTDFFLSDWTKTVEIETSFQTDVTRSYGTLAESRRSLLNLPVRAVTVRWTGVSQDEANRILFFLMRAGTESVEIPLYSDQVEVSSAAGTTINCDPANKRFHVGRKILIHSLDQGRPANVQRSTIAAVNPGSIDTNTVIGSHGSEALAYPVIDALPVLDNRLTFFHDAANQLTVTFLEDPTGNRLPNLIPNLGDFPANFPLALGGSFVVFDIEPNWVSGVQQRLLRAGNLLTVGRARLPALQGERPLFQLTFDLLLCERSEHYRVLEFFDSRRGRCLPFFATNPVGLWDLQSLAPPVITASGNAQDIEDFVNYVALVLIDGTIYIEVLNSVTDNGPTFTLNIAAPFPATPLSQVKRICPAHLVRFSSDSLQERWRTDTVVEMTLDMQELVEDKEIEVVDL